MGGEGGNSDRRWRGLVPSEQAFLPMGLTMGLTLQLSLVREAPVGPLPCHPSLLPSFSFFVSFFFIISSTVHLPFSLQFWGLHSSNVYLWMGSSLAEEWNWPLFIQHDRPGSYHKTGAAKSRKVAGARSYLGKWQLVEGKRGWPQASARTLSSLKPSLCELWSLRKGLSRGEQWLYRTGWLKHEVGNRVEYSWPGCFKRGSLWPDWVVGFAPWAFCKGRLTPDGEVVCPQDEAESNYFSIKFLFLFRSPFSLLTSPAPSFFSFCPPFIHILFPSYVQNVWLILSLFTTELPWAIDVMYLDLGGTVSLSS